MRNTYLNLTDEDRDYLVALTRKRTIQARIVDHAKILLYKSQGLSLDKIAEKLDVTKRTEYSCAAEPPVRGGVSHLSRRNEPL